MSTVDGEHINYPKYLEFQHTLENETNLSLKDPENLQLNLFINELIVFILKKHDEGIEFDLIKRVIIQQIHSYISEPIKESR